MKLETPRQVGKLLGALRRRAGLKQTDLAAQLFVSVDVIRTREQARAMLRLDELLAITNQLGYDVVLVRREQP